MGEDPLVFALGPSSDLGEQVAAVLGIPRAEHEEREFEDGEHKSRPLVNVSQHDVYVLQSLFGETGQSVNDKLVRMLFFIGALRESGAGRVTAVVPYLCYSRKDRRTKPYDPVTTRYLASLFEAVGTDRVVTMDVHNPAAYQNAFRISSEHIEARHFMVQIAAEEVGETAAAVVSPDSGGAKRAERFRERLEQVLGRPVTNGIMEKRRSAGEVSGDLFAGDVEGRTAIIVDDLIAGGTTLSRAAAACRRAGARRILGLATHGVFTEGASETLGASAIDRVLITDSVPPRRPNADLPESRVRVVPCAPFVAEAVNRLHAGKSLADMSDAYGW